jgi:hypothetical protein
MPSVVYHRREYRQIALRWPFSYLPTGTEHRSVTFAVERTIRLCGQLAFPVRTRSGERQQLRSLADQEESLVAKTAVESFGSIVAHWPGVDQSVWGGITFDGPWGHFSLLFKQFLPKDPLSRCLRFSYSRALVIGSKWGAVWGETQRSQWG